MTDSRSKWLHCPAATCKSLALAHFKPIPLIEPDGTSVGRGNQDVASGEKTVESRKPRIGRQEGKYPQEEKEAVQQEAGSSRAQVHSHDPLRTAVSVQLLQRPAIKVTINQRPDTDRDSAGGDQGPQPLGEVDRSHGRRPRTRS